MSIKSLKLSVMILFFLFSAIMVINANYVNIFAAGNTYYVSPAGSDSNPGTEDQPWKTFSKVADTIKGGDTAVFEDGVYEETRSTVFRYGGTEADQIVVKARNKHKAVIIYPESTRLNSKIVLGTGNDYITIKDLEITQKGIATTADSSKTSDIFINCRYANNCSFIGNKIYHAYEEGIKLSQTSGALVEGNIIYDMVDEGIDMVNVSSTIVRNNEVYEIGRVGIMEKGGSRSIQIYNNYVHNSDRYMKIAGITLGGETISTSTFDINGYESYNSVAWNNKIIAENPGKIKQGVSILGSINCAFFNNIIIGAEYGVQFSTINNGIKNGWAWNPTVNNPVIKNNIFMDCVISVYKMDSTPNNLESDYNIYYNSPNAPAEPNSIYTDPKFINNLNDWNLRIGGSAIDSGTPVEFTGYFGEPIDVSGDFYGIQRTEPWDMGIYNISLTLSERFNNDAAEGWSVSVGTGNTADGAYSLTNPAGRATAKYDSGLQWTDYEYSADVRLPSGQIAGSCAGIIFRVNNDITNYYALRFYENTDLEFARWVNGKFASIQKWKYTSTPGEVYNLKVVVNGSFFRFYVNGEEVLSFMDDTHSAGTVGLYAFKDTAYFDNVQLRLIDKAPPVTTAEITGVSKNSEWYVSDVTVKLSAISARSTVLKTEYVLSVIKEVYGITQTSTEGFIEYTSPITLTEGVYELSYRSYDIVGNTEENKTVQIMIDKTAPSLILKANDIVLDEGIILDDSQPFDITALVEDYISGVAQKTITVDGETYVEGEKLDFTGKYGNHTIYVTAVDEAGNTAEVRLNFSIASSISSLKRLVERYAEEGLIDEPLRTQLFSSLEQVEKHMEDFRKHLNNTAMEKYITDAVRQILEKEAQFIIKLR